MGNGVMAIGPQLPRPSSTLPPRGYPHLRRHERLKGHLGELVEPKIGDHRGRFVKNTGDGFLLGSAPALLSTHGTGARRPTSRARSVAPVVMPFDAAKALTSQPPILARRTCIAAQW